MKFYESEQYKKADELVKKHATGFCLRQMPLPDGGVLEKWRVGRHVVTVVATRMFGAGKAPEGRDEFTVDVLTEVSDTNSWSGLEGALQRLTGDKVAYKDALQGIKEVRDYYAVHGVYPYGSVAEGQQFDDWAADFIDRVLTR